MVSQIILLQPTSIAFNSMKQNSSMKKNVNIDYQTLMLLENTIGKEEMIKFFDRYQYIITQDVESEIYLKSIFSATPKKAKKLKKTKTIKDFSK